MFDLFFQWLFQWIFNLLFSGDFDLSALIA